MRRAAVLLTLVLCLTGTLGVRAESVGEEFPPQAAEESGEEEAVSWAAQEPEDGEEPPSDDPGNDPENSPETGSNELASQEPDEQERSTPVQDSVTAHSGQGDAQTALTLRGEELNAPSFLVSIPTDVALSATQATEITVEASAVQNLEGRRISVRFGGTQFTDNQLVLQDGDQGNYRILLYTIQDAQGRTLIDTRANGNTGEGLLDTEIVGFPGNGSASFRIAIRRGEFDPEPVAGADYYGTLTYTIALAD